MSFKKIVIRIVRVVALLLIKLRLLKKMIVVRVDGGICSQMHFYLVGQQLVQRGYTVKYDLKWFKTNGTDLTGKFCRNFDLKKAFPTLRVDETSYLERLFYLSLPFENNKNCLDTFLVNENKLEVLPPAYMGGYYGNDYEMMSVLFPQIFSVDVNVLNQENRTIYERIRNEKLSVAIHVRRGDLADFNIAYGQPVGLDYFIKVLEEIYKDYGQSSCFLFSDEPKWIKDNMINKLPHYNNYEIININGSDRGYFDMFLISACNIQITSKGSLGKYGGLLNSNKTGRIYVYDDEIERHNWQGVNDKIIFVK